MKYWLLTTEFPPIHGGGISTYCWHTAKMLSNNGYNVTVFLNDYSIEKIQREQPIPNVNLIRFNPKHVKIGEALGPDVRLSLEFSYIVEQEIIKSGKPDILETQDYLGIGYYTLQKKLLKYPLFENLKVVLTIHAPSFLYLDFNQVPHYKFPEYWVGEMEKASIRMADLVLAPSNYILDQLESRMHLTDINASRLFNPYYNEWTTGEIPSFNEGEIVFFGKLTPQKGCIEMLHYLRNIWAKGFELPITIIGGGDHFFYPVQEDMIVYFQKKYAAEIKKGLIKFEGNMPPDQLKNRLLKAHVVITPSIVDNLPYAVLEAMAMGKVVLGSTNSGHTEVIQHTVSGFLFDHSIKDSFENELNNILNLSALELEEVGKNAQLAVESITNYTAIFKQKDGRLKQLIQEYTEPTIFPFIEPIIKEKNTLINEGKKGKLSIVIPYYNMGDFIEDTLNSLTKITYKNSEILIIDDGSTEQASIQKIEQLKEKYSIIVYHKPNEGLSDTRNFGAEKATGEYLAFLDADDTVSSNYYEKAINVLCSYENISFVGCWAQYFGESTDIWPTFNPEPPYLLLHNMINSSALVYKTNDFLSFGFNDPKMIYGMEDYESVINMVQNGARGVALPETLWNYRIRKNSMAQSFTTNKELYLYRLISKKHAALFNKHGSELANLLNHNGSGITFDNPTWPNDQIGSHKILNSKVAQLIKKNKLLRKIAKKAYRLLNK